RLFREFVKISCKNSQLRRPSSEAVVCRGGLNNRNSAGVGEREMEGGRVEDTGLGRVSGRAGEVNQRCSVGRRVGGLFILQAEPPGNSGWSIKGFAAWLLAIPYAAAFSLMALTGEADGEFYNEGLLVYAAIGWWL